MKTKTKTSISEVMDKFPNQPLIFKGKIIAVTKVRSPDGMAIKVSLEDGTYAEFPCGQDEILFGRLLKHLDIDKEISIWIVPKGM